MWPFHRSEKKRTVLEKVVVGLVIGGAIGSIVGKKLLEKHHPRGGGESEGSED